MTNDAEPPADPVLVGDLVAAARAGQAWAALEAVATAGYASGVTKAALLRAGGAALDFIADGAPDGTDDPAYDAVLDLMDRLEGFCSAGAEIEPLPRK
ncbi:MULTISPECIES: hypothetical protein [unclassified Amycolatopsis]|uniref:hypothetical protein n=1 Tax=unclassified Amycolatopsis TaxID=2618356 RepID=UPI00287621E6|nr:MULTISPECIES: hypothetical protein [unclassified Amycolatopsis]MDS0137039.1 hypothetical protein [Amycolatopsis sp. 505]MDS0143704.1 hypothetical protein [Amycolatopsis sp. CM201R]